MCPVTVAVMGAGLIGRRHVERVRANPGAELAGIVDPALVASDGAEAAGAPVHASLEELLATRRPDGVIVATPNVLHVQHGLSCIEAGIPVLVEKPIADTLHEGTRLVEAAEEADVPLLVGHHRRHSPILAAARDIVQSGALGPIVAVIGSAMFYKPDDYFDAAPWRREPGGGPILLNMIHEIDNLRSLAGEIVRVQATSASKVRGFPVEETVAITLRFASDALGTFMLSDAAASPRSWEQTSGEDTTYPSYQDEDCYVIAGTTGSLAVPTMRLRRYDGKPSWWEPFESSVVDVDRADPLARQLAHFCDVIRGQATPLVTGRDGVQTLRVTMAIAEAASSGEVVDTA